MILDENLPTKIRTKSQELGFASCRFTSPDGIGDAGEKLRDWITAGRHGTMGWMSDRIVWRASPSELWPDVRSIILLADNYTPANDPMDMLSQRERGAISVYAQGRDYHDTVKKRLKRLGRWLIETSGGEIKVFVDTAPVMEKPLAAAAGLGWQGKHTNLVSRELGSWFFIGAIFTTLTLPVDQPHQNNCGGCRRCLDICPTAAFPAPYQLDATRCISYLTIELKGPVPRALRPAMGNRIYGCDDCLAVCPWNKFADNGSANIAYAAKTGNEAPDLANLAQLDDQAFRTRFKGSPIKRIGRSRFIRNVLIAIGNSGSQSLADAAIPHLTDQDAVIRGAAVWALSRLLDKRKLIALHRTDPDAGVAEEWASALNRNQRV